MAGDAGAGGSPLRRRSSTRAGTRVPTSLGHRLVYQARVEIGSDGNRRLVDAIGDVEAVDDFSRTVHGLEPVDAAEPALIFRGPHEVCAAHELFVFVRLER